MHSSTSNFKWVFLISFVLLAVYSVGLKLISFPLETGQSQFQENKIKLENFVFENKSCHTALVGSSLAYRLRSEDLGSEYCNLAFAGSSALTGLEILLEHKNSNLKSVYIEMNVLRPQDKDLLGSISGLPYWLKQSFLFFQNRYQPITVFVNYLRQKIPYVQPTPTQEQFQFWLREQQKDYSQVTEIYQKGYEEYLSLLKHQISQIEAMGIEVRVIEVPMDSSILSSPKHLFHRKRFAETFPDKKVFQDPREYQTDDGLHLGFESAQKFTSFIKTIAQ